MFFCGIQRSSIMALSTAQPMKLLSLCVGFHGYSVKDSTDSQLSFVLVTGLSGLHSHSDFFSPLRPQWSSHIFSSSGCFSLSQMEMSTAGPGMLSHQQRSMKRRRWGGLRQQWKLLGLFEIDQQHEFYSLTCMMKEGLAAAIQNTIDDPPANELTDEDFRLEVTQIHKDFTMKTFAGPVFATLRGSLGMTEQEYQQYLCSENCYLQFISNSKSKADFFLTNDKRFFLKTQNKREIKFLLGNLKIYMEHLRKYPHSLLVKFLGVHRIQIPQRRKKFFIVMQSVFYPDDRINARYDIKGCEVSRWTEPAPEGSHIIVVLKDLNFEGQFITLGQQRSWLLRQVEIDTHFLRQLNVLDYSLLLAHQPLHHDERHQGLSFATLIVRAKKSVNPGSSPIHMNAATVPGAVVDEDPALSLSETDSGLKTPHSQAASRSSSPRTCAKDAGPASTKAELQDFQAQNRRLLPNLKNPLHIIDGPEQRYFVGIIDIFTVYSFKKRLEHLWKRLRHPGRSFSTVSPQTYCLRLCQWVQDHTK
ncbi:phosphatidylinositol 4-phosphate 5-kinase-like protein 1 isoform X1 [Simochromis diagramma]|uniref:phosphatidylinositol 4-phosphate 5-kinase-like protein 1 isoform X1 n=3 Tax=Simochromis diagramma TaxID=43689 RepID=UPI001A7E448E|nr:phosphatidylinositol 4-phosphate 5-kinase-like protein 1 isoform X1 [Simochromis diagramma]